MPDEPGNTLRFRILRYTPNLVRDEWVNVGVLLEEVDGTRRAMRLIEDASEIARVRRLHPGADEGLLRALPSEFDARLRAPEPEVRTYLENCLLYTSRVLEGLRFPGPCPLRPFRTEDRVFSATGGRRWRSDRNADAVPPANREVEVRAAAPQQQVCPAV